MKQYKIVKVVEAENIEEAIKKEKDHPVETIAQFSDEYQKKNPVGFQHKETRNK